MSRLRARATLLRRLLARQPSARPPWARRPFSPSPLSRPSLPRMPHARGARLALALLAGLLLAGCWDRRETNELAIVSGYGVDWSEGRYLVTAEMVDVRTVGSAAAGGGGGTTIGEPQRVILTGHGADPAEALGDVEHASSRDVFWEPARVLVIGEQLARRGIEPLLQLLAQNQEFGLRTRVLVARGPATAIYAQRKAGFEITTSTYLSEQLHVLLTEESSAFAPRVYDVLRWDDQASRALLLPAVRTESPEFKTTPGFAIEGGGVFEHDRLVAWLPKKKLPQAVYWLTGRFVRGDFDLPCPAQPGELGHILVYRATGGSRPLFAHGRPASVQVSLSGQALLTTSPCSSHDLRQLDRAAATEAEKEVRDAIAWAQEHRVDIFGWGEQFYRRSPALWTESYKSAWPATFARLPFRLRVRITLRETGSAHP